MEKQSAHQIQHADQNHHIAIITNNYQTPSITIPASANNTGYQQQSPQSQGRANPNTANNQNGPQRSPGFFVYPERIVNEGVSACKKSLLGKIITTKTVHVSSIQMGLESIWGSPPGLKIQEIEGKILQFFMDEAMDQERILLGNPWIFRNSWLIIQPWDRNTDITSLDFDHAPIWIQLWGLPPHCETKQMGESIGALLGKVEASEMYEYPGKKMIIKIKVAIHVQQPIAAGILIGNANDGTSWIDFHYEKLPQVCFKCGIVGHVDKLCHNPLLTMENSAPIGPWIRSNHMMEQMAAMKVQDEKEAAEQLKKATPTRAEHQNATSNAEYNSQQRNRSTNETHKGSSSRITMEDREQLPLITQAKRQRMEITSPTNMEFTREGKQMAGPARQASQPQ
ncbi:hypothetical protein A2U01_0000903 [Trifolium medium]|uniref:CCHC-type domain-containing protein n=1 Tax=Trifolium medium TaxID=97028 RepID=A0A392LYS7_9FABA|nr:hypothetical protein [Trifolium medium]